MTGVQRNPPGPAGRNFVTNAERLRWAQGLSYEALAAKLAEAGHPVGPVSLSRLGRGERRAGVDDLVAFAQVLGVTPAELLAPPPPPPGPASPEANARFTCAALAEAVGQVAAKFHDIDPPARDSGIPDDALVTVLSLWAATVLAALPRGKSLAVLEALGLRAAAGQPPPGEGTP